MFLLGDIVSLGVLIKLVVAALLWVLLHLLIRFHPRGIEIVGVIFMLMGFLWWIIRPGLFPPYGPFLLIFGLLIHVLGRVLHRLRQGINGGPGRP